MVDTLISESFLLLGLWSMMHGRKTQEEGQLDTHTELQIPASVRFMVQGGLKKGTRGEENRSGERRVDRRTEIHALFSNVF